MRHKKIAGLAVGLLLVVGGLSGCNSNKQGQGNHDSGSKITKSSRTDMQNSSTSDSSSSESSSSQSSSSSSPASDQSSATAPKTTGSRISTFNNQITQKLGNVKLPTTDGLGSGSQNLNMRYRGTAANYVVYYSVGSQPQNLNAGAVANETAYASFQKKTYASSRQAAGAVNYSSAASKGLPKVKLSSKITGYENAGGGQRYIAWNEGRWAVSVHGSVVNNTDPKQTAKHTVSLLDQNMLPVPESRGTISFNVHTSTDHTRDQAITWQAGRTVYTLKGQTIDTSVKMATSVK